MNIVVLYLGQISIWFGQLTKFFRMYACRYLQKNCRLKYVFYIFKVAYPHRSRHNSPLLVLAWASGQTRQHPLRTFSNEWGLAGRAYKCHHTDCTRPLSDPRQTPKKQVRRPPPVETRSWLLTARWQWRSLPSDFSASTGRGPARWHVARWHPCMTSGPGELNELLLYQRTPTIPKLSSAGAGKNREQSRQQQTCSRQSSGEPSRQHERGRRNGALHLRTKKGLKESKKSHPQMFCQLSLSRSLADAPSTGKKKAGWNSLLLLFYQSDNDRNTTFACWQALQDPAAAGLQLRRRKRSLGFAPFLIVMETGLTRLTREGLQLADARARTHHVHRCPDHDLLQVAWLLIIQWWVFLDHSGAFSWRFVFVATVANDSGLTGDQGRQSESDYIRESTVESRAWAWTTVFMCLKKKKRGKNKESLLCDAHQFCFYESRGESRNQWTILHLRAYLAALPANPPESCSRTVLLCCMTPLHKWSILLEYVPSKKKKTRNYGWLLNAIASDHFIAELD